MPELAIDDNVEYYHPYCKATVLGVITRFESLDSAVVKTIQITKGRANELPRDFEVYIPCAWCTKVDQTALDIMNLHDNY